MKSLTAKAQQESITEYKVGNQRFEAEIFFRPPFVATVQVDIREVTEMHCMERFVLIGIHVRPARAYSELNGLVKVYNSVLENWRMNGGNALILGDLNGDCSYFGPVDKAQNILYREKNVFKWLVQDGAKTNIGKSRDCAYDR